MPVGFRLAMRQAPHDQLNHVSDSCKLLPDDYTTWRPMLCWHQCRGMAVDLGLTCCFAQLTFTAKAMQSTFTLRTLCLLVWLPADYSRCAAAVPEHVTSNNSPSNISYQPSNTHTCMLLYASGVVRMKSQPHMMVMLCGM